MHKHTVTGHLIPEFSLPLNLAMIKQINESLTLQDIVIHKKSLSTSRLVPRSSNNG